MSYLNPTGCNCLCHDRNGDANTEGGCRHCSEIHEEAERREKEREKRTQRLLRRRFERMKLGAPLILLAFAAPLAAQDLPVPLPPIGEPVEAPEPEPWEGPVEGEPEPVAEPEPAAESLPSLYVAAWCAITDGEDDDVATCDQGLAGALYTWDPGETGGLMASWVLFGGPETAGTGLAVSRRLSERVVLGVGAGYVFPIPEEGGLDLGDGRVCLGVTGSFW